MRIGIFFESGEVREVHYLCLLLGYGADVVNPYLVFECLGDLCCCGILLVDEYFDEVTV